MDELRPLSVRLRLGDPALADDLVRFFRKRESSAERVADDVVEVAILHTLGDRQGRMELELYLRVFEALHPDAHVEVIR
jgi:hypothetical protein